MTSTDAPGADKPAKGKPAAEATRPAVVKDVPLVRAAGSADPVVQHLLAQRHSAVMVKQDLERLDEQAIAEYDAVIARVDADLAVLGFAV